MVEEDKEWVRTSSIRDSPVMGDDGPTRVPGAEEWKRKETEEVRTGGKGEEMEWPLLVFKQIHHFTDKTILSTMATKLAVERGQVLSFSIHSPPPSQLYLVFPFIFWKGPWKHRDIMKSGRD